MTLRREGVALTLLALWWCGPALAVRLPLRPPKSRPPVAHADGAEAALLQVDAAAAPTGPRFVESHTADTAHSRHAVRSGVRAKTRVGDGWAYNFDEPPKTLQPPWAKAPEMGEFDLPAPPPAWTPPPPPPMGMYGEERAFPPPPSPPPPPPPPIPPPPPKAPEGADESFVERSGKAHGGSGAKGKRKPALPSGAAPPFDANSPFASLVGLPFAMPDAQADAFGGNGGAPGADPSVDFSRRESYPPPAGALLPGAMGGYADGGAPQAPPAPAPAMASAPRPSGAADVPPTPDANYVFPGLPAVPPLNSPNMPTPPQRADAHSAGWDPDEAVAHVPGADDAARW